MHGGRIEASSGGAGRGSAFTIHLPVVSHRTPAEAVPATAAVDRVPRRVVVIDDNEDAARTIAMLVNELGGETRVAHDGQAGLRSVAEFRPDVVLLDIGMPGIDGYEICRRIRREPFGQEVVIVALTGWGQDQDKQHAIESGFDAHLTKPADPATLERILAGVASGGVGAP